MGVFKLLACSIVQLAEEGDASPDPDARVLSRGQLDHLDVVRVVARGQQLARSLARLVRGALIEEAISGPPRRVRGVLFL